MNEHLTEEVDDSLALQPPPVLRAAEPRHRTRAWQGIPGIEVAPNGRLWATWYSGGEGEPRPENFVMAATSGDDGETWSDIKVVVDPPGPVRAFDPCPWIDPNGRLWLFWAQCVDPFDGRFGVWAITTDEPGHESPRWSEPRRLANGIMMCKPIVTRDGRWLMPSAIWPREPFRSDMDQERYCNVYESTDQGATWSLLGSADAPDRWIDEHMVIERKDGSLWMLIRVKNETGIAECISTDGGRTWSHGEPSNISGPNSRFFIRRLQSGRMLLVNHDQFTGRSHMTAMLSDDEGRTWPKRLLLDEREKVSYPDGAQAADGTIYVVYDRMRKGTGEILLARFTEEDIEAGKPVSAKAKLKHVISRLDGGE